MKIVLLLLLASPAAGSSNSDILAALHISDYTEWPGGRTGFGWEMSPPVHRDAELFPVVIDGKWGFINPKGELVIDARYDAVRPCVGGAAAVRVGSRWGVLGRNGKLLVSPAFDDAGVISDGMLAVRKGDLWTFLSTGQMAKAAMGDRKLPGLAFSLEPVGDFHEGYARVYIKRGANGESLSHFTFISKDLTAWAGGGTEPFTDFSEGVAAVRIQDPGTLQPAAVFIDSGGRTLAKLPKLSVKNFTEGSAPVGGDGGWGYVDRGGRWTVRPRFARADPMSGGRAACAERNGSGLGFGFIDAEGLDVVPRRHTSAESFWDGMAAVCDWKDGGMACGYVDSSGKAAVPPRYKEAFGFVNSVALVLTHDGYFKYIGKSGRDVWSPAFTPADLKRMDHLYRGRPGNR